MRVYREADLTKDRLEGATVAIVGYGNQGHAHAQNLRDSGTTVVVAGRADGEGVERAKADGFDTAPTAEAVAGADYVALLLPDEVQGNVFDREIRDALKPEATLVFAHGYTVTFGEVVAPAGNDVVLVAPKGQGHFLRKLYKEGRGLMCLVGVEQDPSGTGMEKALSYAKRLGCLRAGAIETTFRDEAVTDLFGEQAVLCGGVPALVKVAYETLVDAGYDPEIAYIECLHELKIIADLMYHGGVNQMRRRISRTAAWGSFGAEHELVDSDLRAKLISLLGAIESGEFAAGWKDESEAGQRHLEAAIAKESKHDIEEAGAAVRALMPYLKEESE